MSEGRIWFVGIFCDRCGRQEAGDVAASSQAAAEDGLRVSLVAEKGWSCDAAGDVCARCRPVAAEAATEELAPAGDVVLPSAEAPAPRRVGPPEVEALHAIDRLIGNDETVDAETLGKVRGILLDTLNAWHQRRRVLDAEHAAWQAGDDPVAAGKAADPGGLWT